MNDNKALGSDATSAPVRTLASRKRRLLAFFIDHITISFIAVNVSFYLMGRHWEMLGGDAFITPLLQSTGLALLLVLFKDSFRGVSLGKFIMGIRVGPRDDQQPYKWWQGPLRNIWMILWPLECLVILNSQKRRMGDFFAGTLVQRDPSLKGWQRLVAVLATVLILQGGVQGSGQHIIKNSAAFDTAMDYLKNQGQIEQIIGPIVDVQITRLGSIELVNGHGHAQLFLLLIGEHGEQGVNLTLSKQPNEPWLVSELYMERKQTF